MHHIVVHLVVRCPRRLRGIDVEAGTLADAVSYTHLDVYKRQIEVFESFMGLSGLVNVGKGALVLGFAAESRKFE